MARKIWLGNQVRPIILTRCAILTPRMTQPNAHPPSRFAQSGEDCAPKSDLFKCSRRRRSGEGGGEQLSWNFLFPTNAKILRHIQFKLMNSPPRNGRKLSQGSHHQFFSCSSFFFFLMKKYNSRLACRVVCCSHQSDHHIWVMYIAPIRLPHEGMYLATIRLPH